MPKRKPFEWRNKLKRLRWNPLEPDNHQVANEVAYRPKRTPWRLNRTPEELAHEREQNRLREHVRRLNRTPDEVIYEREQNRLRERLRRSNRTPEEIFREREQNRIREHLRRLNRTPEEVIRDREQSRIRQHLRRSTRTPEEVECERKQNRVRSQLRRCNRTPDEITRDREENKIREQVRRLPTQDRNFAPSNLYLSNNDQSGPGGEFEWFNEYLKMLGYHTCVCYQCSGLHCFAHANCMKEVCNSVGPKEGQGQPHQHQPPPPLPPQQQLQQQSCGPEPNNA